MSEFCPKVHNFVLSPELADSILCWELDSYKTECPSFAVLLDHTLAVIWHVFNDDGAELYSLNKADITWALRFIEAIDTARVYDTTDLDLLKECLRKILITRYALEDEQEFTSSNKTLYESISEGNASSSALEDFLCSDAVMEDMEREKMTQKPAAEPKCTEAELLNCLKKINPNIQSLDDLKALWWKLNKVQIIQKKASFEVLSFFGRSQSFLPFCDIKHFASICAHQ